MDDPHHLILPSVIVRDRSAVLSISAPVSGASHNFGERLPKGDPAGTGAGTKVFVAFSACCVVALLALFGV
jgi:hypothetical protein